MNDIITDPIDLQRAYTHRDGFVFTALIEPANVFDAIVIRNPEISNCWSPRLGISALSLEEHIEYINKHRVEKAVVIAENIAFITRCPSLSYLQIMPADTAQNGFDYSPLYEMPHMRFLTCATAYGRQEKLQTSIDYSKVKGLKDLSISASMGDMNYNQVSTLKRIQISHFRGKSLESLFSSEDMKEIVIPQSAIHVLSGIDRARNLDSATLCYNKSLSDVSALENISHSLRVLCIENCPAIHDFSSLKRLINLEHLQLCGGNTLPDLSFVYAMKRLKSFVFTMDVRDGDLSPCLHLAYADCGRSRRHFNLRNIDLPKGTFDVNSIDIYSS